jgi:hypothetical protein
MKLTKTGFALAIFLATATSVLAADPGKGGASSSSTDSAAASDSASLAADEAACSAAVSSSSASSASVPEVCARVSEIHKEKKAKVNPFANK